jgi:3-hydroxybutyryl-CoA dehydrogenase
MMFENILVIGSGVMGTGLASRFALKGINVTVLLRTSERALELKGDIEKLISKAIKKEKLSISSAEVLKRIIIVDKLLKDISYDFIFEAVSENIEIKKKIIRECSEYITAETIWASNTSSLSVTDMAASYLYPTNFIGLHFFNPVSSMELVEIIPSMLTSSDVTNRCWDFCLALDKKPVCVKDSPGFIVNRLLIPMINEAIEILSSEVATADEIDSAMKLGAHHPLGPLALADLIGNDVCLSIMEALYISTCDSKYRPSYLLRKMVSAKKLGRKTGVGFFSYKKGAN